MYVTKRNGNKEYVHFDKITSRISKLTNDLDSQIDPALVTQKTCSSIYSGISTTELDNLACQICMGMISDHPDYGILGSRIAISNHQKNTPENFSEVVNILYQNKILEKTEVINIYKSPEDFHLVLNGRVVRNHSERIGSLVDTNATFFINASKIHGGCCPNFCG